MASKVLIIEDDRLAQRLYSDHLLAAGYLVETADTGENALEMLRSRSFDILVTDMILPGIDGLEVLSEARNIDSDIGVIMISALDVVDPAVRSIKAGAFDYLVKPFDPETLRLAVQRCLEYRCLLWENIDLKRHLALSQAGARIASASEQDRVCHQAAEAIAVHMEAILALVVSQDEESLVVNSAVGSGPPLDPILVSSLHEWLRLNDDGVALSQDAPEELRNIGKPLRLKVPGPDSEVNVLAFPGRSSSFGVDAERAGHFLIQHLGQALQALDRLEAAQHLAYIDDLTQLFNGRYLHRVLDRYMDGRTGGQPFAILFIDLDRFKTVNDEHGHLVGSELLMEVATVLKSCIRDGDVAVRYGGDEYVIVLPQADQGTALKVAERMRRRVEEHTFLLESGKALRLTVSVGVACYPEHTTDKRRLIELADHAMYRGKRGNRNVVYMATPENKPM